MDHVSGAVIMNQSCFDVKDFRRACGKFPTGITVTTLVGADGQPYGITLNSFTSISLTPPLVLVCIDHRASILPLCGIGRHFGINILGDCQEDLSVRFSGKWSDRFVGVRWQPGVTGVPLLEDVPATLECITTEMIRAGDHWIVIGQALHVRISEKSPLAYFASSYGKVARHQPDAPREVETNLEKVP
jgi:flavin reductase (DIM6/NTAB) family NADH-FMN oxidoreductase RutF